MGEAAGRRQNERAASAWWPTISASSKIFLRLLVDAHCDVTVVPAQTSAEDVLALKPDGVFLSNGPGDPEPVTYAVDNIRKLLGRVPVFGICLGHQLCGLALGGKHLQAEIRPPRIESSGEKSADRPRGDHRAESWLRRGPGFVAGERRRNHAHQSERPHQRGHAPPLAAVSSACSIIPKASPGPHDSHYLFRSFIDMMSEARQSRAAAHGDGGARSPAEPGQIDDSMPKRTDIKKILIIGSGPIVIGQACEFDYSGTQACKALRADGYKVVLVNSNPATIMTDPEVADRTYIEPLTRRNVWSRSSPAKSPDALLPTVGGQTALNLAVELAEGGVLERYGVELIGASLRAIKVAEDRLWFKDACRKIGLDVPASALVNNAQDALRLADQLGYPVVIRPVVHARRHRRLRSPTIARSSPRPSPWRSMPARCTRPWWKSPCSAGKSSSSK